jgi:hypothetical protein
MLDVQRNTIQTLTKLLDKWEIPYKILMPDGQELGTLPIDRKPKRGARLHPMGTYRDYFLLFVKDMKAGDVVEIPCGQFDLVPLRGAVAAWAVGNWGKGSATTHINSEKQTVEVLRLTEEK